MPVRVEFQFLEGVKVDEISEKFSGVLPSPPPRPPFSRTRPSTRPWAHKYLMAVFAVRGCKGFVLQQTVTDSSQIDRRYEQCLHCSALFLLHKAFATSHCKRGYLAFLHAKDGWSIRLELWTLGHDPL